jgi:hypothetical protein
MIFIRRLLLSAELARTLAAGDGAPPKPVQRSPEHTATEEHRGITKKGITRCFHKLRKNLYKNSIYFALLEHRQEYINEPSDTLLRYFNMFHLTSSPSSLQFTISW